MFWKSSELPQNWRCKKAVRKVKNLIKRAFENFTSPRRWGLDFQINQKIWKGAVDIMFFKQRVAWKSKRAGQDRTWLIINFRYQTSRIRGSGEKRGIYQQLNEW